MATSKKAKRPKDQKPSKDAAEPRSVGKPLKFPDLDKLKEDIEAYFHFCNPHIEMVQTPVLMTTGPSKGTYEVVLRPELTTQRPYTISGLAYFLGTNRTTLLDYENLAVKDSEDIPLGLRTKDPFLLRQYTDTIKRAKARCEAYVEERLLSGGHPVGSIFNLKNNYHNWEDKTVHENPQETENRKEIDELRTAISHRLKSVKRK